MEIGGLTMDKSALGELCRQYGLSLVILFGSQATGQTHGDSDIDIGFYHTDGPLPAEQFFDLYARFSEIIQPGEIDLVDLNRVTGLLKHIACERGIVLYESQPGVFDRFRVLGWNLYQDERLQIRSYDSEAIQIALRSLAQ